MRRLVTGTIVLSLTACTVGPDFSAPAPPPPEAGYASDTAGNAMLGEGPSAEWWTAFGSNELDALVAQAIERNASLAASRATLERARAQVVAVAGKRLPQANASARADYEQVNLSAIGIGDKLGAAGIGNPEFDLYTVGGGIGYDLDLFGRNRRALEQAAAQAEAQQHETAAAHLVIAGQVVVKFLLSPQSTTASPPNARCCPKANVTSH